MKKIKKAIIFGTGAFAELTNFYLENDSEYNVFGFIETAPKNGTFLGKPLISFKDVENYFSKEEFEVFVAVGYKKMNSLREEYCEKFRCLGYKLLSYVSSKATCWIENDKIGENVFIFEDNTIQPFTEIGSGTILWSGNHVGHHSKIGKYCFISSHVVISGYCSIGENCFLGVNSTIVDGVTIKDRNFISAGSLITKNTELNDVYKAEKASKSTITSDRL